VYGRTGQIGQVFCIRPTRTRVGLDREKAPDPPNPPKMFFAGRFCSDLGATASRSPFRIPSDNQIIEKRIARAHRRADEPSYYPSPANRSHYPTARATQGEHAFRRRCSARCRTHAEF
jgi:hypothetical protein